MNPVRRLLFLLPLVLVAAGCGSGESSLPALTDVEGVVLLGGQPLPFAKVQFNPTKPGLPANSVGIAVTDEAGRFKLMTAGKPGAIPGEHVVTVVEGPPPADARGPDSQDAQIKYQAGLKNRPIPGRYGAVNTSDARVTVETGKKDYTVDLKK
jgi:hypothetical protein